MKVRMLATAAGPEGIWPEKSQQNLPDMVALTLIAGGYAVNEEAVVVPETPEEVLAEEQAILEPLEVAGRARRAVRRKDR